MSRSSFAPGRLMLLLMLCGLGCSLTVDLDELQDEHCGDGEKACSNNCVSRLDPQTGCAGLSCVPCALANAASRCEGVRAECAIARCNEDFRDCNLRSEDGCEVDLAHDPENCGACGEVCEAPSNAVPGCGAGICGIGACVAGFRDCNSEASDGCEVDLHFDPAHCGECGLACATDEQCVNGMCEVSKN